MAKRKNPRPLATEIRELQVAAGHLAIWALGQQGYILKSGDTTVIIDPYLSNSVEGVGGPPRQVEIAVQPGELDMIDLVLATHHHIDHCDPSTLMPLLAASAAPVWTSYTGRDVLLGEGVAADRIAVPAIGARKQFNDDLAVTAIPSAHYTFEPDVDGNPSFLGFIIELNGVTVYHSGDTIIYEGMLERLREAAPEIAFVPINGRDWFREQDNLVGNLDYREAADLVARAGVRLLIPGHNDMFASNSVNPAYLVDYVNSHYPKQRVHFLQAGELYYYVQ